MIEDSGLRGRGGAGFPTARKWKFAFDQESSKKSILFVMQMKVTREPL